jgi:hypothetical protein
VRPALQVDELPAPLAGERLEGLVAFPPCVQARRDCR